MAIEEAREDGGSPEKDSGAARLPSYPVARLLVLCGLICLFEFWYQRQLGRSFTKGLVVGAVLSVVTGAVGLYLKLFTDHSETVRRAGRRFASVVLGNLCLITLASLMAVAGSFVTWVTVLADGLEGRRSVVLRVSGFGRPENPNATLLVASHHVVGGVIEGSNGVVRFPCITNPFGRSLTIEVDGYLQHSFELHPIVGARIRIGRDLPVAPTLLIRVPASKHALLETGRLELWSSHDVACAQGTSSTRQRLALTPLATRGELLIRHGSALFGFPRKIPDDLLVRWEREMRVVTQDRGEIDVGLLLWLDPIPCPFDAPVAVGMDLRAFLLDVNDTPHAMADFTLTSEPFQDVLLRLIPDGTHVRREQ